MKSGPETRLLPRPALTTTRRNRAMARMPLEHLLRGVTRFGRLTVLGEAQPYKWGGREYRLADCLCDCGVRRSVQPAKLRSGQTVSCGCYGASAAGNANRTHGMSGTPEYISWQAMKQRCYHQDDISYSNYGGRGITVCDRWRDSFAAFYADMGSRPEGMTLDRIEVDKHYEPSNCRWATPVEQADNTRVARKLLVGGGRINLSEASRRSGLSRSALRARMGRGMTAEVAMRQPIDRTQGARRKSNNRYVFYRGRRLLLVELSELTGIVGSHINYHIKRGRTAEEAVAFILERRKADA